MIKKNFKDHEIISQAEEFKNKSKVTLVADQGSIFETYLVGYADEVEAAIDQAGSIMRRCMGWFDSYDHKTSIN